MNLIIIAFACAAVSFTITVTSIFYWLRELVSPIHNKVEELIHCPWCLNHYIVFATVALTGQTVLISGSWLVDFFITSFSIIGIGGVIHFILLRAYAPISKTMAQRQINKLKNGKTRNIKSVGLHS